MATPKDIPSAEHLQQEAVPERGTPAYYRNEAEKAFAAYQLVRGSTPTDILKKVEAINKTQKAIESFIRVRESEKKQTFDDDYGKDIKKADERGEELIKQENARIQGMRDTVFQEKFGMSEAEFEATQHGLSYIPSPQIPGMPISEAEQKYVDESRAQYNRNREGRDEIEAQLQAIEKQRTDSQTLIDQGYQEVFGQTKAEFDEFAKQYTKLDQDFRDDAFANATGMTENEFKKFRDLKVYKEGFVFEFQSGKAIYELALKAKEDPSSVTPEMLKESGLREGQIKECLEHPDKMADYLASDASLSLNNSRNYLRHTESVDIKDETFYEETLGISKKDYETIVEGAATLYARGQIDGITAKFPDIFTNPGFDMAQITNATGGIALDYAKSALNLGGIDAWSPKGMRAMGLDPDDAVQVQQLQKLYHHIWGGPMPAPLPEGTIVPDPCQAPPDMYNKPSPSCDPEATLEEMREKVKPAIDHLFPSK